MKLDSMRVSFPEQVDDGRIEFVTAAAEYRGQWVLLRLGERATLECAGGRRAPDEPLEQAARRLLARQTGAAQFDLARVCPYAVKREDGASDYGMLFFAHVELLNPPPKEGDARVELWERLPPANWTYPDTQPFLLARIRDSYPV